MDHVREEELALRASDGYVLHGQCFESSSPARRTVIVNSAACTPASVHRALAFFLAARGYSVITYDYRGVGRSRPASSHGFHPTIADWAQRDFRGVLRHVLATRRDHDVFVLGHGVGGLFTGLVSEHYRLAGAIAVSTTFGTAGLGLRARLGVLASRLMVPVLSRFRATLPTRRLGWDEDCPASIARAWLRWSSHRDFLLGFPRDTGPTAFDRYAGPLLVASLEADRAAPRRAVDALAARFPRAKLARVHFPSTTTADRFSHELMTWLDRQGSPSRISGLTVVAR